MNKYVEADCSYCTLFDSFYLDRGITMLYSLINNSTDIRIYVLAMDKNTFSVLQEKALEKVIIIRHDDFATNELLNLKKERSVAEYCWTCTARLIEYIFKNFNESICTYIDADLYFYQNPFCLVQEMLQKGCSVQIVEHRFGKGIYAAHMSRYSGVFCVQFNTFMDTNVARNILEKWIYQCTEHCSSEQDGKTLGDQKYLEEWPKRYDCVNILENEGGGVAPWNIHIYRVKDYYEDGSIEIENKFDKKIFKLIFYHFHGLELRSDGTADIGVFTRNLGIDKELVNLLYVPYIRRLWEERENLGERFKVSDQTNGLKKNTTRNLRLSCFLENFYEKSYCKIRSKLMKMQKNKDIIKNM